MASPGKKGFLIRMPEDLHTMTKAAADRAGVSMSDWIIGAIDVLLGYQNELEATGAISKKTATHLESAHSEIAKENKGKWWLN